MHIPTYICYFEYAYTYIYIPFCSACSTNQQDYMPRLRRIHPPQTPSLTHVSAQNKRDKNKKSVKSYSMQFRGRTSRPKSQGQPSSFPTAFSTLKPPQSRHFRLCACLRATWIPRVLLVFSREIPAYDHHVSQTCPDRFDRGSPCSVPYSAFS
jgi:hypothetical protein